MIRAYDEIYLDDAKNLLSQFFDYLTGDCALGADWAAHLFVSSGSSPLKSQHSVSLFRVSLYFLSG